MHCTPDAKLSLCPPRSECDCPASSEVKQWPWQRALVFSPRLYRAMAAPTAPSSSSSTSCHGEPNPNTANLRPPASSRCIIHIKRFCTPAICFGAAAVNLGGEVEGKWRGRGGWWWGWNGTDWSPPQVQQITSRLSVRIKSTHWGQLKKTDTP